VRINFGWCEDWPTGSAWIPALFGSGGVANYGFFSEPAVDDQIEEIGRLPLDEQPAAWAGLDKTIMTDYYPAIVTSYDDSALLHGSKIGGMNIDQIIGTPTWKDIYVTE
jgi:peptide/nickel transport system substrate-binding protein